MWPTVAIILTAIGLTSAGCAQQQQDYRIISVKDRDRLMQDNTVVVEGHVVVSKLGVQPPTAGDYFWHSFYFYIPAGFSHKPRYDATIAVDRVLKGNMQEKTLELTDYRSLTPEEHAAFVDNYGIHQNSMVCVGYDQRCGGCLTNLAIVPLGNTAEFDKALRQAAAQHAATRPAFHSLE